MVISLRVTEKPGICSWFNEPERILDLPNSPKDHQLNTKTAHAIQGHLHELGHCVVDGSEIDKNSHKLRYNYIGSDGDYYVTPMLTGYDRRFIGEYNECGEYIDDPADGNSINLLHYYSDCFKNHIE